MKEGASLAGYSALIQAHNLKVPFPDYLCAIGTKHKKYDYERWNIFTPRHRPDDTLYGHLIFAFKYEGIDLAVLSALFQAVEARDIEEIIRSKPTGMYSRKLWFLWGGEERDRRIILWAALIIAVPHREYRDKTLSEFADTLMDDGYLVDVKSMLNVEEV